jgi:hypothetical protein
MLSYPSFVSLTLRFNVVFEQISYFHLRVWYCYVCLVSPSCGLQWLMVTFVEPLVFGIMFCVYFLLRANYNNWLQLSLSNFGVLRLVGDAGRRSWRFQNRGSPSDTNPDEPSLCNEDRNTPSPLLQDQLIYMAKPGCRWEVTLEVVPCQRPHGGDGLWRRSSVCRRSLRSMTWQGRHTSHPHSWGMEVFINLKGL